MRKMIAVALAAGALASWSIPGSLRAEPVEDAGVAVGVTAGNLWFVPIKAISVANGMLAGALSFIVTGGNGALTQQIWQDTLQGPYVITPEVARKAVGQRPELLDNE